jgi:hypothetical protein
MMDVAITAQPAADGQIVDIVLDDPHDDAAVEITLSGRLPEFGDT